MYRNTSSCGAEQAGREGGREAGRQAGRPGQGRAVQSSAGKQQSCRSVQMVVDTVLVGQESETGYRDWICI